LPEIDLDIPFVELEMSKTVLATHVLLWMAQH
jgi:hypothetical protein